MPTPTFTPDPFVARATLRHLYPLYHALRDQSPVHYLDIPGNESSGITPLWWSGLLKYEDAYAALRITRRSPRRVPRQVSSDRNWY